MRGGDFLGAGARPGGRSTARYRLDRFSALEGSKPVTLGPRTTPWASHHNDIPHPQKPQIMQYVSRYTLTAAVVLLGLSIG